MTYHTAFRTLWAQNTDYVTRRSPHEVNTIFKSTARMAYKQLNEELLTQERAPTHLTDKLTTSIKLYRAITTPTPDQTTIDTIHTHHPDLAALTPDATPYLPHFTYNPGPLRAHIATLLGGGEPGPGITQHHRQQEDRSEGAAIFRNQKTGRRNPSDTIAPLLPSTSKHLHALRESLDDTPTTHPLAMTKHIQKFWGGIWQPRPLTPSHSDYAAYLATYNKTIPTEHMPIFPTIDRVTAHITKPKHTKHGPDGLPFALYRAHPDIVGPILLDIITEMASGTPPPPPLSIGVTYASSLKTTRRSLHARAPLP